MNKKKYKSNRGRMFLLLLAMVGLFTTNVEAASDPKRGKRLVFNHDFSGDLDKTIWSTCPTNPTKINFGGRDCWAANYQIPACYKDHNVKVSNGVLKMSGNKEANVCPADNANMSYTTSYIDTEPTSDHKGFAFRYGYIEAKVKIPKGNGFFPAFRLKKTNGWRDTGNGWQQDWPPELDIFEIHGDNAANADMGMIYGTREKPVYMVSAWPRYGDNSVKMDYSEGYHTFGLEWAKNKLVWYVDGVERLRCDKKNNTKNCLAGIPHVEMFLIANLQLEVSQYTHTGIDATTPWQKTYDFDYIRVWQ